MGSGEFADSDFIESYKVDGSIWEMALGSLTAPKERIKAHAAGLPIEGEHHVSLVQQLSLAKREYDKVALRLQTFGRTDMVS